MQCTKLQIITFPCRPAHLQGSSSTSNAGFSPRMQALPCPGLKITTHNAGPAAALP